MLCFPRKAFGGKGQRLLGVNALLPQGVHGGKQQLTSRLRGVFRCSGIPGRLRRVQGILCLPGRLAAHAMACRTEEDVRRLFCIEAPSYWRTHHVPGAESNESPKRIGAFKANIIGINLVAVLQFAYGSVTGRETLRDSALTLLERLPAEDNRYMRNWRNTGVMIRNAFESQALLQLATEYCPAKRCTECPVGRRILQSISSTE